MLSITIDRTTGDPIQFDWEATAEEAQHLYSHLEEVATSEGREPRDVANAAIQLLATKGELKSEVQRRGQRVWVVYAVLRFAKDNVDLSNMIDQAGDMSGPPTIFDLAEHQRIKA